MLCLYLKKTEQVKREKRHDPSKRGMPRPNVLVIHQEERNDALDQLGTGSLWKPILNGQWTGEAWRERRDHLSKGSGTLPVDSIFNIEMK